MEKKKKMNKKAQVSIEVLAILSILVIGSIIFGVYYLSMARKNIEAAAKLDIKPDLYVENNPTDPGTGTGEIDPPGPPGGLGIIATVTNVPALIFENFDVNVSINNLPSGFDDNTVEVYSIKAEKQLGPAFLSTNNICKYNYQNIPSEGLYLDSNIYIGNNENDSNIIGQISCLEKGTYQFQIYAQMQVNHDNNTHATTGTKDIKQLDLYLSSPGGTQIENHFKITANVLDYLSGKPVRIKNIAIDTNNVCDYNGIPLTTSETVVDISVNETTTSGSYSVDLNLFSCSVAGDYNFIITAGELNSNDTNKNDINSITKEIYSVPGPFALQLSLVPVGAAMLGTEFAILSQVKNYSANGDVIVNYISVEKNGEKTSNCYLEGYQIPDEGKEINYIMQQQDSDYIYLIDKLSCSVSGDYNFIISGKDTGDGDNQDTSAIEKEIGCEYTGTGQLVNPYQIWEPKDLHCVRYFIDSNFKVMTTIDLNHEILRHHTGWYDPVGGWSPIIDPINSEHEFSANFNGDNKIIKNMYIYKPAFPDAKGCDSGLFAGLDTTAIVSNLKIEDVNLALTGGGALFGYNYGSVDNVYVNRGLIQGSWSMGGLGGCNYGGGRINQSNSNNLNVSLELFPGVTGINAIGFGGLIGENKGLINQCYSTANVSGVFNVGGLVGYHSNFLNNTNPGPITLISNSYAKGDVEITNLEPESPETNIGGLIGQLAVTPEINDDYNTTLLIDKSYATGEVSILAYNDWYHGGIIGRLYLYDDDPWISGTSAIVENSYWDTETSGESLTAYVGIMAEFGWGRTSSEMKDITGYNTPHYYPEGDPNSVLYNPWNIGESYNTIWNINSEINQGYPYLRNNPPPEGE